MTGGAGLNRQEFQHQAVAFRILPICEGIPIFWPVRYLSTVDQGFVRVGFVGKPVFVTPAHSGLLQDRAGLWQIGESWGGTVAGSPKAFWSWPGQ